MGDPGRNAVSAACWRPRRRASCCLPERRTPLAFIAVLLASAIATPLPASMRNTAASPTSTRTGGRTSACIAVRALTVQVAASLPTASTSTVPAETNAASAVLRRWAPAACLPAGGTSADRAIGRMRRVACVTVMVFAMNGLGQSCGKAGRMTDGFCLARPSGQGINGASAWPRDPVSGACGKDNPIVRKREDVVSRNVGNFLWDDASGSAHGMCAAPLPRLPLGFLRPLERRETGRVLFVSVRQCPRHGEIREETQCETQGKRQDERTVDGGAAGAFAGGRVPVAGRETACAPGRGKNGGPA